MLNLRMHFSCTSTFHSVIFFNLAQEEICHKARWDPSILAHCLTKKKSYQLPRCNLSDSFSDSCSWAVELCGHHHHHFYHYHYKDYCTKSLRVLAYLTVLYDLVEPFHWTDSGLFIKTLLWLLSCAWVENTGKLNIGLSAPIFILLLRLWTSAVYRVLCVYILNS